MRYVRIDSIAPMRKDVTAKCYGGDVTRKMKLLQKAKEGKKRLKMIGMRHNDNLFVVPHPSFFFSNTHSTRSYFV